MRKASLLLSVVALWLAIAGGIHAQTTGAIYGTADLGAEGTTNTATFFDLGAAGTRVRMIVAGLAPGSTHVAHIHTGSCTGPVLYPLAALVADAQGNASADSTLPAKVEFGQWYVDLHGAATDTSESAGCGAVHPALGGAASAPAAGSPGIPATGAAVTAPLLLAGACTVLVILAALVWRRRAGRA